jgi:leader peptidase (prepilin peptidase)/N-methyltransferase
LTELPHVVWVTWWGLVGLFVGSFLNVAIHRLPLEGETVSRPRRSRCPKCKRQLTWKENVPVFSWLVQLGRCRGCAWRIPWRYPFVELLTAGLWVAIALRTGFDRPALLVVQTVVVSGLIVATFVDFDYFEIPDEVSIGGIVLAPVASLLVPELHIASPLPGFFGIAADGELTRLGALVTCLCGMAVGGGVLLAVGWLGSKVFGRDAMGFGDVKLLAGAGGFIGPGGVLVALMIASLLASVAGLGNILRFLFVVTSRHRARGKQSSFGQRVQVARIAGRYVPFGPYLAIGIGIVLVAWKDVIGRVMVTPP